MNGSPTRSGVVNTVRRIYLMFSFPNDELMRFTDSDLLYINLVGTPVIILNSAKHAVELFEKRSSLYSDRYEVLCERQQTSTEYSFTRPKTVMLGEL